MSRLRQRFFDGHDVLGHLEAQRIKGRSRGRIGDRAVVVKVQFDAFLDYFEQRGCLDRQEGRLSATEKGRSYLLFLAEQTRTLFEAYYAATCALQTLEEPTPMREVEKAIGEQFERAALMGEVERREAANPVTFGNALDLMLRRGVIQRRDPEKGRDPLLAPGPAFDELAALRERLAGALAGR